MHALIPQRKTPDPECACLPTGRPADSAAYRAAHLAVGTFIKGAPPQPSDRVASRQLPFSINVCQCQRKFDLILSYIGHFDGALAEFCALRYHFVRRNTRFVHVDPRYTALPRLNNGRLPTNRDAKNIQRKYLILRRFSC
jgi:hypothetical protein